MKYLRTLRDSAYVDRFHNTVIHRPYNVGFHTYNAITIVHHLLEENKIDPYLRYHVMTAMMVHDAHEVYTGDVPGNFKWDNLSIRDKLKSVERKWETDNLPRHIISSIKIVEASSLLSAILTQADLLELGFFILDEILLGNKRRTPKLGLVLNSSSEQLASVSVVGIRPLINFIAAEAMELDAKIDYESREEGEPRC